MKQTTALNLQPGDEVELDGQRWIVTEHAWHMSRKPADINSAVTLQLQSKDREFLLAWTGSPVMLFNYEPQR